ncbi:MAG: hypothetical protein KC492_28460, partial [Myxococcales bacterium]|nr:hypothetical protein [Myxococcales bacterium]
MHSGTITELDPYDSLGWIELDTGERVRFGGTSLSGFQSLPGPGTRVWVEGTVPGFRGVPKATRVLPAPLQSGGSVEPGEPDAQARSHSTFVAEHPRWSDLDQVWLRPQVDAKPLWLPPQSLFAPWHAELVASTPVITPLSVPNYRAPDLCEPTPHTCVAQGLVAFLEQPEWPACGRCGKPLEHCIQLTPAVMLPWGGNGRGFVAMFCFECGIQHREDPR